MELLSFLLAVFQDLPTHLAQWTAMMGPWIYILMFLIIFAETGLIVTPFLPGDSLLFALGALTAVTSTTAVGGEEVTRAALDFKLLLILLIIAAVLGDMVNYSVGRWIGLKLFTNPNSKIFNPEYLRRTQEFYDRHGGKTIVLARFIPIIRTYAPFVAGLGRMKYRTFAFYNVLGGVIWISVFLTAGHYFGNIPHVKKHFQYVILAIIVISVLPVVIEYFRAKRKSVAVLKETQQ